MSEMHTIQDVFIEVGHNSLNKKNEELCGDKVEVFKSDDRVIIVLADGLGSGVKANILATLTSKIAITMLQKGANIEEVIDTIVQTLPVCKVRNIAYSTFSIIEIDRHLRCKIFESENPPFFFVREGKILNVPKKELVIMDKTVMLSEFVMQEDDIIYVVSDGVIHAGVGQMLNFGWQWEHVARFVEKDVKQNAELLSRRLLQACNELYEDSPGDDTTIVTVKLRKPTQVLLFTGPPADQHLDGKIARAFMDSHGKKIVCGGTAANIMSRELHKPIKTQIDYFDPEIPPTGFIDGIDLVTEGVLTIQRCLQMLEAFQENPKSKEKWDGRDGASQLFRMLLFESSHIDFWLGKAINQAHQHSDFPSELSIKITLIKQFAQQLRSLGKIVHIRYESEIEHEIL